MRNIILLIGASGSGKTTLEKTLCSYYPSRFHRVVTATTRTQKEYEVAAKDYYFLTPEEFKNTPMAEEGFFAGCNYGTPLSELENMKDLIVAIEPSGAKNLIQYAYSSLKNVQCFVIYFDIPEPLRIQNMLKRGDNKDVVQKRLEKDDIQTRFIKSNIQPHIVIDELSPDLYSKVLDAMEKFNSLYTKINLEIYMQEKFILAKEVVFSTLARPNGCHEEFFCSDLLRVLPYPEDELLEIMFVLQHLGVGDFGVRYYISSGLKASLNIMPSVNFNSEVFEKLSN